MRPPSAFADRETFWSGGCAALSMRKQCNSITLKIKNRFVAIVASAGGVSIVVFALAFLRQVLIAGFFGVARELDIYVMLYAIAAFVVFTFAGIFDTIAVPHLVRMRELQDEAAVRSLAAAILRMSLYIGVATSMLLLLATPLLVPIIATGFSANERTELVRLIWYFLPWTLICLPYYALAAWHKAHWRFTRVFTAEVAIVAVSLVVLAVWHDDIRALPLAYAAGYGVGVLFLATDAGLWRQGSQDRSREIRSVLRNVGELYLANQSGGVSALVDRNVQSFVPAGGIAAINYSAQLVNGILTLLNFREIFIVPLAQQSGRADRLERLVSGLILLAAPVSGVVICFGPEIVKVLFERGRFDAAATALTSTVLQINALSLVTGAIMTPLARMFQIVDRIQFTHVMYLTMAVSLAIFGYLFVGVLDLGVRGVAWMQVASSTVGAIVTAYLVSRCSLHLRWWRVASYLAFALVVSAVAYPVATLAASPFTNAWARLFCGGAAYGLMVAGFYIFVRSHLHGILFGVAATKSKPIL
jgi:putative peptidoglycan lipid II flippase